MHHLIFAIVINDPQTDYRYYYKAYFIFLFTHFGITWTGRWLLLSLAKMQIRKGKSYSTVFWLDPEPLGLRHLKIPLAGLANGYQHTGYVHPNSTPDSMNIGLSCLGSTDLLEEIVDRQNIQLVVIALGRNDQSSAEKLVQRMSEKMWK
jgi:hypothetical protein